MVTFLLRSFYEVTLTCTLASFGEYSECFESLDGDEVEESNLAKYHLETIHVQC